MYYYKVESKKGESIEILRNCFEFAEDEKDKKKISNLIDVIEGHVGGNLNLNNVNELSRSNINTEKDNDNDNESLINQMEDLSEK